MDTGATVLTMPDLLDEAFAAVGEKLAERLDLVPLDPAYRAHFADGSTIDVHTDADAMEAEIRRVCGPDVGRGLPRAAGVARRPLPHRDRHLHRRQHRLAARLLGPDLVRLARLGGFGRLGPRVARFLPDDRLRRIFSFQSLYAGVAPDRALGAYGVIAYMDTVAGVWFPRRRDARDRPGAGRRGRGGRGADPLRAHGHGLQRRDGRVTAVRHRASAEPAADSEPLPCDAVVLTPDLPVVDALVGRARRRPVPLRWSPSAVVLHAGLRTRRPDTAHHTISFGAAWERTFDRDHRRRVG